jgi:hypothetical protein
LLILRRAAQAKLVILFACYFSWLHQFHTDAANCLTTLLVQDYVMLGCDTTFFGERRSVTFKNDRIFCYAAVGTARIVRRRVLHSATLSTTISICSGRGDIQCVRKVAVHLKKRLMEAMSTNVYTGLNTFNFIRQHFLQICVRKVALHLQNLLEVMSTGVYTGLNPFNFIRQHFLQICGRKVCVHL